MSYSVILLPFVMLRRLFRWIEWVHLLPLKTRFLARAWKMDCGMDVRFVGRTIVRSYAKGAIQIGNHVTFMAADNRNLVGLTGPTILCAAKGARIGIGDYTGLSSPVINARQSITIGKYVNVGGNVRIFDHDFHPLEWENRRPPQNGVAVRSKPVVIEDDVFIGTNAIILKGTHIGARSIVAAGSVVFGLEIPPDSLVKGNPAVVVSRKK